MRKIEIVEIENSFLNFFTPAVLVAISYFFLNLIGWPSLFIKELILQLNLEIELNLITLIISNVFLAITCFGLYYLLIYLPRLKVHDVEFQEINKFSFFTVLVFFCIAILSQMVITEIFYFFYRHHYISQYLIIPINDMKKNPINFILSIIFEIFLSSLYIEIVYRRVLIPTLEDRGLSPFHAVIFAALGDSFIKLPSNALNPNHPVDIYNFFLTIIIGICAGLIYILTRNILFPILFSIFFTSHQFIGIFIDEKLLQLYDLIDILLYLISVGILIYYSYRILIMKQYPKLIKTIRKPSSPNITKGIVGFFVISLGLLTIQTIVAKIGRVLFNTAQEGVFPEYFIYISIFYAIAFIIPFFLTISTEWAKHPTN